jgi:hypothetical protein
MLTRVGEVTFQVPQVRSVDFYPSALTPERRATMTKSKEHKTKLLAVEAVAGHGDLMKALMKEALQEVLEGEMSEFLGAAPGQRTESRTGYRAAYHSGSLITRIGKLEMCVPRDRNGNSRPPCSTARRGARERWWGRAGQHSASRPRLRSRRYGWTGAARTTLLARHGACLLQCRAYHNTIRVAGNTYEFTMTVFSTAFISLSSTVQPLMSARGLKTQR